MQCQTDEWFRCFALLAVVEKSSTFQAANQSNRGYATIPVKALANQIVFIFKISMLLNICELASLLTCSGPKNNNNSKTYVNNM